MGTRQASGVIQLQFMGTLVNVLSSVEGDESSATWGEVLQALQVKTGLSEDQINRAISAKEIVLASGASTVVDLFDYVGLDVGAGDAVDGIGQPQAWNEVVGLLVVLKAGSTGQLRVGGEGSGAAWNSPFFGRDDSGVTTNATTALPGIIFLFNPAAGSYTVTDVTNHLLKLEASGGVCTLSLHLIGRDT